MAGKRVDIPGFFSPMPLQDNSALFFVRGREKGKDNRQPRACPEMETGLQFVQGRRYGHFVLVLLWENPDGRYCIVFSSESLLHFVLVKLAMGEGEICIDKEEYEIENLYICPGRAE